MLAEQAGAGQVLGSADRIVICCGLSHALALLVDALRTVGRARIAMEDPCLPRHRALAVAHGAEVVPVPVDGDGIRVDELVAADPDVAVLTPAHQYPMGVTLSDDRRRELLAWARRHGRLLVEDDYDAEFRYEPSPPGELRSDRVAGQRQTSIHRLLLRGMGPSAWSDDTGPPNARRRTRARADGRLEVVLHG